MALAEIRVKAKETQDAQIIFFNSPPRLADEANAARADIIPAADIVVHFSIRRDGQPVDREIAALGVLFPIAAKHDARLAAEGFDILAQRRDLEQTSVDDGGHRAMLDTGRYGLPPGCRDTARHGLGQRRGRDIDFTD